ncbi:7TM diverse intracellular signaling domain-containing protein [Mucilaginibacter sp. dw_454]|uniref:sensor histidine kinase n=1 Tax=Mucilaginibacter sp. dw_454 TaxID=2720079 RepID=UPI001BD46618|nr:7TM diverse intracellular signaling domain-containing protein [Mucilaginibacter sp. dw_454]
MGRYFLKTLIFFAFLFLGLHASADVIIDGKTNRTLIGREVYVLQPGKELGLSDVLKSAEFKKYDKEVPNLGFSEHSVWLRFTVTNKDADPAFLLDVAYPILDEVELFSPDANGKYHDNLMGEVRPFNTRKYDHPNYIFDLDIPQHSSRTYYLRVKSAEQLILPISINEPATLWQVLSRDDLLSGLFIGAIVIMFLYNLFIYFSVKDRSYLYYVIYVASVGLTQIGIKGFTFQYLWGNQTGFELKSVVLFACIGPIAALLFTKIFLSTSIRARRFDKVLTGIIVLMIVAFVVTASGQIQTGFKLMQLFTTLFAFSLIIVSLIVMYNGYRPARFVFLSWLSLLIGAIIFTLKDNGVLPYNTFTGYSMQVATAVEMALLSFGLADRINILKKEKEASQAEALNIAKENERIIREQNVVLELKVSERTQELNQSFEDLKQAQSQLVDSEKMASLGQLTAGIAHEINNPINFVTSNINPLKRDVETILEVMNTIENVSQSDLTIEEKKKQIEAYKEEVDFDYLVVEIRHLINGIYEGATRTAEIVKGLRIFSRLDEDDLKLTDINEGLESTLIIANNLIGARTSIVRAYGELPLVECYAGKLNQVFLNIISNAAYAIGKKYGDKAGGEIKVGTVVNNGHVEISISDNGAGMSDQTMKKIFEPFFTTKDVGEGTGLGMSIAYNTIRKHNGQIVVNSEIDKGTAFILKIPLIFDAKPALPHA